MKEYVSIEIKEDNQSKLLKSLSNNIEDIIYSGFGIDVCKAFILIEECLMESKVMKVDKDNIKRLKDISFEKINNIILENETKKRIAEYYHIESLDDNIDNLKLSEEILNDNYNLKDIKSYILLLSYNEVSEFFTNISKFIGKLLKYEYFEEDQTLDFISEILNYRRIIDINYNFEKDIFDKFINDDFMIDAYHCGIAFYLKMHKYISDCISNDIFYIDFLNIENLLNEEYIENYLLINSKNKECKEYL